MNDPGIKYHRLRALNISDLRYRLVRKADSYGFCVYVVQNSCWYAVEANKKSNIPKFKLVELRESWKDSMSSYRMSWAVGYDYATKSIAQRAILEFETWWYKVYLDSVYYSKELCVMEEMLVSPTEWGRININDENVIIPIKKPKLGNTLRYTVLSVLSAAAGALITYILIHSLCLP